MASSNGTMLDLVVEECDELETCITALEEMYYTCGAAEVAIEHLLIRYTPVGQHFKNLDDKLKDLKDVLDGHMVLVRLFGRNAQKGSERLQNLKKLDFPEMRDDVNNLALILFKYVGELRQAILQATNLCREFHLFSGYVLDYLENQCSEEL